MTTIPAAGYFTGVGRTNAQAKTAQNDMLAVMRESWGAESPTSVTIATGSVTPTTGHILVDTEGAASTDDLTNIATTNLPEGRMLMVRPASGARTVVVKHAAGGAGQISLVGAADYSLDDAEDWVLLERSGTDWREIIRGPQVTVTGYLQTANNLSDVANAATAFGNIKQAATDSATGVVEIATTAEAEAGVASTVPTCAGVASAIAALQRPIASQAEAEAGTDNTKDMTPLRVAQAIAALASSGGLTSGTAQATTSGSSVTFGSIPTGTKQITVSLAGVSRASQSSTISVQIGDAGGLEATGYLGSILLFETNAGAITTVAGAFHSASALIAEGSGFPGVAAGWHGTCVWSLVDASTYTWAWSSIISCDSAGSGYPIAWYGAGTKSLSAELTQISVLTSGTFDAGKVNILYQ